MIPVTLRIVTLPAGQTQLSFTWGPPNSKELLRNGRVLDVPPGSALETAIGTTNLTVLSDGALVSEQTGSDAAATENV